MLKADKKREFWMSISLERHFYFSAYSAEKQKIEVGSKKLQENFFILDTISYTGSSIRS